MYNFTRRVRMTTESAQGQEWVAKITEKVTQITGWEVSVWARTFSTEVGTLAWSVMLPDLASIEAGFDKMQVDPGYAELSEQGREHVDVATLHDGLYTVVHPTDFTAGAANPTYATIVDTTVAPGQLANGILLGIEIAQLVTEITASPCIFETANTGNYGAVRWVTLSNDIQDMQRAEEALNADTRLIEVVDSRASKAYTDVPGAATQSIYRRII